MVILLQLYSFIAVIVAVVQSLSCVQLFETRRTVPCQALLSSALSWSLFKFMSIELMMLSNHLILCCPLLILPSIFPTSLSFPMNRLFSSGVQSIGASASASVFPVNIQGLFPLGLTDLLAVQGTLRSLLQYYNLKASILWHSAFFMVQLSHLYMTTGKILTLTK